MARRTPNQEETEQPTATTGGAPGIIPDAATVIPGAATAAPAAELARPERVEVPIERFRVKPGGPNKDGSWPILYGSVRANLSPGKVVDTASYDLDYLRRQGVLLEKVA